MFGDDAGRELRFENFEIRISEFEIMIAPPGHSQCRIVCLREPAAGGHTSTHSASCGFMSQIEIKLAKRATEPQRTIYVAPPGLYF